MQKGTRMKYLPVTFILVLLSGCSSLVEVIAETAFEKATDTEISYVGASCPDVLYISDSADDDLCIDFGARRILENKKRK